MISLLIAALLAQAAPAPPLSEAQLMWDFRCKSCHEPAQAGIPDRTELSKMRPAAIVRSLERGNMKPMGETLTKAEKRVLADFITGRS